ncbi:hypothetical protein FNV43_RR16356 [Rhamnella rubrinervis]|uniref:Uncharacterized protein n=1 Tax=Rhamnella rubrinervis TaxID=2594499 RepID=A0A8K0GYN8_9ROSA|nr:hypothetical protein FNV43_RR16356 [Rhamnella rubrinervis]
MSSLQKAWRLILSLIMLFIFVVSSEARFSLKLPTMPNQSTHQIMLRELRYQALQSEFYRRKLNEDARPMRVSPGGPDPQHH